MSIEVLNETDHAVDADELIELARYVPVSYTHLDVYKRQGPSRWIWLPRTKISTMERNLPSVEIFVRGNQIHLLGPELELDLAERLLDELLAIAATGQQLNRDAVERSIRMLREHVRERPADVLLSLIHI